MEEADQASHQTVEKNSRAIVGMQITRHTKLSVIPAPLLGEKQ